MKWRVELSDEEVRAVLEFLEVGREAPSRMYLGRLQRGYKARVPWETASRVVRASEVRELEERTRRPPEFWALAMEQGSGGTCFESNYAFWGLLRGLGFEVALHVNDMPQSGSIACHSSLVVMVDGERYLVDVGMGTTIAGPIPLPESGASSVHCPDGWNEARRVASNRWRLEMYGAWDRLDDELLYEFVDRAWPVEAYDAHVAGDYGPGGLFLDAVRITRWFADGTCLRFSPPNKLLRFDHGRWEDSEVSSEGLAGRLAGLFGMPEELIAGAFEVLGGAERAGS